MGDIKKVKEIYENYEDVNPLKQKIVELEHMVRAQHKTIDKLNVSLAEKDEKLAQMESLLAETVPAIKKDENQAISFSVSTEEEICELQIRRLQTSAKVRDLSTDEAKRLEIYHKIKKSFKPDRDWETEKEIA